MFCATLTWTRHAAIAAPPRVFLRAIELGAQAAPKPPAAIAAIRQADLERDLYVMGGDAMRGREAGTIDEMRASVWSAEQMAKIGLEPWATSGAGSSGGC